MHTFAQKPKPTQQTKSTGPLMHRRRSVAQNQAVHSILHLQRTIGNQAVQRLLKADAESLEVESDTTATTRFAHDFSRIPVHAGARSNIQPKLKVNAPRDQYEQEADRVADQVMHMPDLARFTGQALMKVPAPFRTTAETVMRQPTPRETEEEIDLEKQRAMLKLVCPECEDFLQAKEASPEGVRVSTEFESQIEGVKAGGLPLPESVREFFEPKFGYDFSRVKIHTDARAGDTAKRMNALAYTMGPHIVFAPGQFAPYSHEGKKLLAHELTHVVQQSATTRLLGIASTFATNQEGSFPETQLPVQSLGSTIKIHLQAGSDNILRHTAADCDRWYEECGDRCRSLPNRTKRDKARRALCWAQCATEYGACLASAEETVRGVLTGLAIAGAVALAAADGPFPIGDAAAVGLLGLVGINLTD